MFWTRTNTAVNVVQSKHQWQWGFLFLFLQLILKKIQMMQNWEWDVSCSTKMNTHLNITTDLPKFHALFQQCHTDSASTWTSFIVVDRNSWQRCKSFAENRRKKKKKKALGFGLYTKYQHAVNFHYIKKKEKRHCPFQVVNAHIKRSTGPLGFTLSSGNFPFSSFIYFINTLGVIEIQLHYLGHAT